MKSKGTRAERELHHLLWSSGKWASLMAAGSGSTTLPCPDLIAGNKLKTVAIECKSIKGKSKYLSKEEVQQLIIFSDTFGSEPWLAIRFDNMGWYFLNPKTMPLTKKGNYNITLSLAKERGVKIEEFISS